ncbi:MAG: metallophosphoesterase [Gemmatimonadaceae bacterium]|jgi:hypothetical protein
MLIRGDMHLFKTPQRTHEAIAYDEAMRRRYPGEPIIDVGDLTDRGTERELRASCPYQGTVQIPGNHDLGLCEGLGLEINARTQLSDIWTTWRWDQRCWWRFDLEGIRCLAFDSSLPEVRVAARAPWWRRAWAWICGQAEAIVHLGKGVVPESVLIELDRGPPVDLVICHHRPDDVSGTLGMERGFDLLAACQRRSVRWIACGHTGPQGIYPTGFGVDLLCVDESPVWGRAIHLTRDRGAEIVEVFE